MTLTTAEHGQLSKIKPTVKFYPHQISGVRELCKLKSFLLADEMGLGKTLEALAVAAVDFEVGLAKKILVVAPASLKWNWQDEIVEHTLFSPFVLDGTPAQRDRQILDFASTTSSFDILIVNYEQLVSELNHLNELRFDIVIFDEAHYIKNHKSKRTKAALKFKSKRYFLLTGSPILNRVDELWSLLKLIAPTEYPNWYIFMNRHAVLGGFKNKQVIGVKNQKELKEKLERVMVRREKKDVLDLPEKQIIKVKVDLHPLQRQLYDQVMEELQLDLPGQPSPMEIENALTKFLRLKQICGTTATIDGYPDFSHKLDRAVDMVVELVENNHHVVVWTQFLDVQAAMHKRLGYGFLLNGHTDKRDRPALIRTWSECAPGPLISMLQVGKEGLNMVKARHAIFLDKLFVPKLNEQAQDRIYRIGTDLSQPVQIFELLCTGTIETRIEAILRQKEKLFRELIPQADNSQWKRQLYDMLKEAADDS